LFSANSIAFLDFFNSNDSQKIPNNEVVTNDSIDNAKKIAQNFNTLKFSDWLLRCSIENDSECNVIQTLINKDNKVLFSLRVVPSKSQNFLYISAPLGISIAPGIVLSFNETTVEIPFNACNPSGCNAIVKLDEFLLKNLTKSEKMILGIVTSNGKKLNVTISLKGFTDAYNSML